MSRFGGGNRSEKKATVIEKLQHFFEKYFGLGDFEETETVDSDNEDRARNIYKLPQAEDPTRYGMVAEKPAPFSAKKDK